MAPIANKRRRVEDEVRPKKKKKIQNFKKQKRYHSSSEDESDDEPSTSRTQRASDAPRPLPKHTLKATVPIKAPKVEPKLAAKPKEEAKADTKPKSILKQTKPAPEPVEESSVDEAEDEDEDEEEAEMDELELNTALNALQAEEEDGTEGDLEENDEPDLEDDDDDEPVLSDSESETSTTSSQALRNNKKKRNDPSAFATSISKILDTKLSTSKRGDPVLSRSKSAAEANRTLADARLEQKAKAQIRAERRAASEKGRVRDVLGLDTPDVDTGAIVEEEKRLKKTAQRGVVKLFNAVRAAQVKAEQAMNQARSEGVVGMQKREERVNEMSKQGFLDLISSGGKAKAAG